MTRRSSWCSRSSGRKSWRWDQEQGQGREGRGDGGGGDGGKRCSYPPVHFPAGQRQSCRAEEGWWAVLPPPHRRAT